MAGVRSAARRAFGASVGGPGSAKYLNRQTFQGFLIAAISGGLSTGVELIHEG